MTRAIKVTKKWKFYKFNVWKFSIEVDVNNIPKTLLESYNISKGIMNNLCLIMPTEIIKVKKRGNFWYVRLLIGLGQADSSFTSLGGV